jgi:hypothetical protein
MWLQGTGLFAVVPEKGKGEDRYQGERETMEHHQTSQQNRKRQQKRAAKIDSVESGKRANERKEVNTK